MAKAISCNILQSDGGKCVTGQQCANFLAENVKKSRPKKLVKLNKSISRNFSLNIFHKHYNCTFRKWKISPQKNAVKLVHLISRVFLPGLF